MPAAGSAASPSEKSLKTKAKSRLEVSSEGSRKMPPRNGRKKASTRALEKPSRRSASAVVTCGAVSSSFSEKRESRRRSRATRSLSGRLPGAPRRLWSAWSGWRKRIGDAREAAVPADERAALEGPQAEALVVERPPRLGVRREQHLEAAVEQEAVDLVRAHAPARRVAALEDEHLEPGGVQLAGAAQAGEAGADDDDVRHRRRPCRTPAPRPARRARHSASVPAEPGTSRSQYAARRVQVVVVQPVEEQPPDAGEVRGARFLQPPVARVGEDGEVAAAVLRAALAVRRGPHVPGGRPAGSCRSG